MYNGINNNHSNFSSYTADKKFKPNTIGVVQQFAQGLFEGMGIASQPINKKYHELGLEYSNQPLNPDTVSDLVTHENSVERGNKFADYATDTGTRRLGAHLIASMYVTGNSKHASTLEKLNNGYVKPLVNPFEFEI